AASYLRVTVTATNPSGSTPSAPSSAVGPVGAANGPIVYSHDSGGGAHLFEINADGSGNVQIPTGSGDAFEETASGQTVVFASSRSGHDEIWTMSLDGSG